MPEESAKVVSPISMPENGKALDLLSGLESAFLLSVMDASQDCIKIVEPDGSLSFMNANGMCALEIDDFSIVAEVPWPSLWPLAMRPTIESALAKARKGERSNFEASCPTLKGTTKWWHVTVLPLRNAQGAIDRILASSSDITERMLREQDQKTYAATLERELVEKTDLLAQKQFLLREIDHRVKNSLSQVAAILRIQARRSSPEVRFALDTAAQRVGSIARVHEHLQATEDFKSIPVAPILARLCTEFSQTFDRTIAFTTTATDEFAMMSDRTSAMCIIVSELVTNAVRHGTGDGPISVHLHRVPAAPAIVTVSNAANGPRLPHSADTTGLGTQICETYAGMIAGQLEWTFAAGQITATLTYPPDEGPRLR